MAARSSGAICTPPTFRYAPLHRVPFYGVDVRLPQAERAADETLCLPLHASLSDEDLDLVVTSIRRFDPE